MSPVFATLIKRSSPLAIYHAVAFDINNMIRFGYFLTTNGIKIPNFMITYIRTLI